MRIQVEISYKTGNVAAMCDLLSLLTKKRGQPKKAVVDMVEFGMKAQSEISNPELRFKLITTLKDICDKKIYLEVNYARCCLLIVKQKETSANIDEAAKILQDVQVAKNPSSFKASWILKSRWRLMARWKSGKSWTSFFTR